jgi:hypothetical protein
MGFIARFLRPSPLPHPGTVWSESHSTARMVQSYNAASTARMVQSYNAAHPHVVIEEQVEPANPFPAFASDRDCRPVWQTLPTAGTKY